MRQHAVVGRSLLVLSAAALLVGGCSVDGSDAGPATSTTTTTGLVRPTTTEGPSTSGPTVTGVPVPPPDGSGLKFRPVLGSQPCSSVTPDTPPGEGPPVTDTTIPPPGQPELVPARDGVICYGLGPAAATGEDLSLAVADMVPDTGRWTVSVTPKPDAVAKLNGLFDACFAAAPTCPAASGAAPGVTNGTVAIELDGQVISAPTVLSAGLGSSPFQISGTFTEREAQTLAARLNG